MSEVHSKNTMEVTSLFAVERGHTTPQLKRVRFGHALAGPEEHCLSLFGAVWKDGASGSRTVDLECKSRAERERWVEALEHLIQWVRTKKLYGQRTVKMDNAEKIQKKLKKEKMAKEAQASAAK